MPPVASVAPKAAAESSSSGTPCAALISRHAVRTSRGGMEPNVEQPSTPATSPSCRSSARSSATGSSCHASGSTSTNSGTKPAQSIAQAVAVKVNDGVTTMRRGPSGRPSTARRATSRPCVALETGTQVGPPSRSAMRAASSRAQGPPLE